jgi:hypothetical protein
VYHTIEFADDLTIDLESSPRHRLEQLMLRKGTRLSAEIKPYVVETREGPVEVADLFFEDDTVARCVPFAHFRFVD